MPRLFLDANVLFSAAYKSDSRLRQLWRLADVALYSSRYALEEARINLPDESGKRRLVELSESLAFVDGTGRPLPPGIRLPEKDVPILMAAIEARADYLLTGDFRHFGSYFGKRFERVLILPPSQFFKQREKER